jgi:chromosome segregation ATPase
MTSAEDRAAAEAATSTATQLAARLSEIGAEIEVKREEIRQARINAARDGQVPSEAPAVVALEGELAELESELRDLPETHFAAREEAHAMFITAESSLIAETRPLLAQAEAELGPLQVAEAQARTAREAKEREVSELRGVIAGAERRRLRNEKELERVEKEGPRPLAAFGA